VWRGELYFEMHRGTLTSQLGTKLGNRRCERLLREAELWWAVGGTVPADVMAELDELWRDVLLQQFHDILPGSSIAWVHADAETAFARVAARLEELIAAAAERLALPAGPHLLNAATRARTEVIDHGGQPVLVHAPACGHAPLVAATTDDTVTTTEHTMANGALCVHWDLDGTITSIIDVRRGRELLPAGRPITFELAPDQPVEYDAWDLESWTRGLGAPLAGDATVEWVRRDPLVAEVRVTRRLGTGSTLAATYRLAAESDRLDIGIDIDWHEHERLLSLMVPLDVRADTAACDIQFGVVQRPTHASSPWDAAKFEVCAHRFVDLAEPSFGVAVVNDGRFGHSLFDGGVRVSLVRGARYPDPEADQGQHRVTIGILPHGPGLHEVLAAAEAMNVPLRVVAGTGAPTDAGAPHGTGAPFVEIDHPGVQLSAVKRADDGSGDLVVRLYESCGDRSPVTVRLAQPVRAAQRANALEEPGEGLDVADGIVVLTLRPFELVTLRLTAR
jgi:alpha-mannosidase